MSLKELSNELTNLELGPYEDWPPNAGTTVLAGLRSGDALTVERAARLAWPVMNGELVDELLLLVEGDSTPEIRATAAIAFGPVLEDEYETAELGEVVQRLGTLAGALGPEVVGRIQASLRRVFEDESQPKLVRRRAMEASVRGPMEWHADAVRSVAGLDDEDWKVTSLFCMGHLEGFDDEVMATLRSSEGDVLLQAVQAAGQLALEEAGRTVLDLASSDETPEELRVEAIYAVAGIRPEGGDDLLQALTQHDDDEIATAAEDALDEYFMDDDDLDDEDEDWDDEDEDED